jgi:hypothetical protein
MDPKSIEEDEKLPVPEKAYAVLASWYEVVENLQTWGIPSTVVDDYDSSSVCETEPMLLGKRDSPTLNLEYPDDGWGEGYTLKKSKQLKPK